MAARLSWRSSPCCSRPRRARPPMRARRLVTVDRARIVHAARAASSRSDRRSRTDGSTPASGLIAHLNVLSLRPGVVRRSRGLVGEPDALPRARSPPGGSTTITWRMQAVNDGDFGVYVAVLARERPSAPPAHGPDDAPGGRGEEDAELGRDPPARARHPRLARGRDPRTQVAQARLASLQPPLGCPKRTRPSRGDR